MAARKAAVSKGATKGKGGAKSAGRGGAQLELVALPPARKEARASAPLARPARAAPPPAKAPRASKKAPAPRAQPELIPEPEVEAPVEPAPRRRATAEQMAAKQREISISEFFTKNRHLLGFDNPSKALLTTIKEAVDNSLDACEEAGILPEITVEVRDPAPDLTKGEGKFVVVVEDNGPGIVKAQVPKIFGKLLYGSKFHRLKQARGQHGIGISA
ncbi:MAG TPA: ATP-binding protein, partial [Anaeromyxobacteraceae bacterium]|nr:ATP-binding protein [Anaeromyxobacteraceae bacterium]